MVTVLFTLLWSFIQSRSTHAQSLDEYEIVTVNGAACFNAKSYDKSNFINPPKNGILTGIRLRYIVGDVTCSKQATPSHWGCVINHDERFYVFFLHVTDETNYYGTTYYPTKNVTGIHIKDPPITSDHYHGNCSHGCTLGSYNLTKGNALSANYTMIGQRYRVNKSEKYMLQYLQACCPETYNLDENDGTTCATIDFIYIKETPLPTTQPTIEPTLEPTIEPTYIPSIEPTVLLTTEFPTITGYIYSEMILYVTYYMEDVNFIDYEHILSNITRDVLIGNLSEIVSDCILDYEENVDIDNTSLTFEITIDICDEETAYLLKGYYNDSFATKAVEEIYEQTSLQLLITFQIAEIDVITALPTTTVTSNVSVDSGSPFKLQLVEILIIIGVSLIIVGLCIFCIVRKSKNESKLKNKELQMQLLEEHDDDKIDNEKSGESGMDTLEELPDDATYEKFVPPVVNKKQASHNSDNSEVLYNSMKSDKSRANDTAGTTKGNIHGIEGRKSDARALNLSRIKTGDSDAIYDKPRDDLVKIDEVTTPIGGWEDEDMKQDIVDDGGESITVNGYKMINIEDEDEEEDDEEMIDKRITDGFIGDEEEVDEEEVDEEDDDNDDDDELDLGRDINEINTPK